MGHINFLKGVHGTFQEYRKLHNFNVKNQKHASKDSVFTEVNWGPWNYSLIDPSSVKHNNIIFIYYFIFRVFHMRRLAQWDNT